MNYGLIGEKLGHSFSKEIHEKLADYTYELKELKPEELDGFMLVGAFKAINVTIPYKQAVIPFLDEISPLAKVIGAVNTVVNRGGKLYGYNTDILGMKGLLAYNGISLLGKKILILGSGGTSKTARALATECGAGEIQIVSRTGNGGITYEEAYAKHTDAQIVINTTPCGMYPHIEGAPLDLAPFSRLEGVVDAIYNPLRTELILNAQSRGIPAAGGLYMLVAQAAYAVEFFLDTKIEESKIAEIYRSTLVAKENIVLTGMPGCGKSTVGRVLQKALNRPLLDTDVLIEERYGKTPAEIINAEGEPAFREKESAVIGEIAGKNGCIIATGGGAILRDENVRNLKKNGKLFFIDRPLELLVTTEDRPLSSDRELLKKRYNERYSRYCDTADISITPAIDLEEICAKIIKEMNL